MAPIVFLIRHGEALHKQCRALAAELEPTFPFTRDDCRIVVSPLRRTLQTAYHGLAWLRAREVAAEVRAEWQETTDNPCDIGGEPSTIKSEWPDLDFSTLDPIYPQKTGMYENSEDAFRKRAAFAKRWLFERPEKCIVVVTHSGFLRRVVEGPKFRHAECRVYRFAEDTEDQDLKLKEISREEASLGQA
ncbi:hypothetical protein AAE478_000212 [Parahypoxylon ruwenzoriense]